MATPLNYSLIKSFKLLALVRDSRYGLRLSEVAIESGLALSTAHRLLQTLRAVGAVRKARSGRYVIGQNLTRLISHPDHCKQEALATLADHGKKLAELLQDTIHIAVLNGEMIRFIVKAEVSRSKDIASRVDTEVEAYCTALGKVLLASSSAANLARYLAVGELVKLTQNTIIDPQDLRRELAMAARFGYAVDNEEFEDGLRCVAVPIVVGNEVVAALSLSGPAFRIDKADAVRLSFILKAKANQIGERLSRLGPPARQLLIQDHQQNAATEPISSSRTNSGPRLASIR